MLVEFYGVYNFGDDLFIKILADRYPEVHIKLICKRKFSKPFLKYKNMEIIEPPEYNICERGISKILRKNIFSSRLEMRWLKLYTELSLNSDIYVNIGGSIFIERNEKSIHHKLYPNKNQIFNKMKRYVIGANFGPYKSNVFLNGYRNIFKDFEDVCFRDEKSKNIFQQSNVRLAPDVVFQLKYKKNEKEKNSVGLSIVNLDNRKELYEYKCNYESFIFSTISNFLGQGKKIYLFSFCKNEGDEDVINYYLNKFSDKNIEGVNYSGNIDIFLDKFSRMETIVGTRFHSIVLALVFKQKLMAISYSDKTNNMLESVGYKGHILDIQNLGEISNIDSFINYDTSLNNNIFSDAIKQFTKLDSELNNE